MTENFSAHPSTLMSLRRLNAQSISTLKFVTVSLPTLGKDIDRALTTGKFELTPGFFKRPKTQAYPSFLSEFTSLLFYKNGYLRDDFDVVILRQLRQICFFAYKAQLSDSSASDTNRNAIDAFCARDLAVKRDFTPDEVLVLKKTFLKLLPPDVHDISPVHSNGATSLKIEQHEKRKVRRYNKQLNDCYGADFFFHSRAHLGSFILTNKVVRHHATSRLALVPKDSRGPRVICMEPHENMFIQQGLMKKIYDWVEHHSPAKGRVNFRDQEVNQKLAYLGSLDQSYCTIDLKDASDMVSSELIRLIVKDTEWEDALFSTRSDLCELPDGRIIRLNKFAPMGSALCFPVEAILFYSICSTISEDCYVYGDDIIIPNHLGEEACVLLESYGLRVNYDKTLTTGFFRESCGSEFFRGHDITVTKVKSLDYASMVGLANEFAKFDEQLADFTIKLVDEHFRVHTLRCPDPEYYGIAFRSTHVSSNDVFLRRRYNSDLQRFEYRSMQPTTCRKHVKLNDDDAYFDALCQLNTDSAPHEALLTRRLTRDLLPSIRYDRRLPTIGKTDVKKYVKPKMGFTWVPMYNR